MASERLSEAACTFTWTIENASAFVFNETVLSPVFTAKSIETSKWLLCMTTQRFSHMYLMVRRDDIDGPESIEIDFDLSLIGAVGQVLRKRTRTQTFSSGELYFVSAFEKDEVFTHRRAEFLPNDVLTVRCEMWTREKKIPKRDLWFARTILGMDRRCFIWGIKGFKSMKPGQKTSRLFKSALKEAPEPLLEFYLKESGGEECVCIDIVDITVERDLWMVGEIAVMDEKCAVVHSCKVFKYLANVDKDLWTWAKQKLLTVGASDFIIEDMLYLRFEFYITCEPILNKIEKYEQLDLELQVVMSNESEVPFAEGEKLSGGEGKLADIESRLSGDEGKLDADEKLSGNERKLSVQEDMLTDNESRLSGDEGKLAADESQLVDDERKLSGQEDMLTDNVSRLSGDEGNLADDESGISDEETNESVTEICPFTEVLSKFYEESTLTDVTLQTSSESFRAHKVVLCCRSAVFGVIFAEDVIGKMRNCYDIPDLDADTLRRLLLYLYKNEVPDVDWEGTSNLFKAANTFELLELKQKCVATLKSNISRLNVFYLMSLMDKHREEELFEAILDFILKNSDIFRSEAWTLFKLENSRLAFEIAERVIYKLTIQ